MVRFFFSPHPQSGLQTLFVTLGLPKMAKERTGPHDRECLFFEISSTRMLYPCIVLGGRRLHTLNCIGVVDTHEDNQSSWSSCVSWERKEGVHIHLGVWRFTTVKRSDWRIYKHVHCEYSQKMCENMMVVISNTHCVHTASIRIACLVPYKAHILFLACHMHT